MSEPYFYKILRVIIKKGSFGSPQMYVEWIGQDGSVTVTAGSPRTKYATGLLKEARKQRAPILDYRKAPR